MNNMRLLMSSKLNYRINFLLNNIFIHHQFYFKRYINLLSYPDFYLKNDWKIRMKLIDNNRKKNLNQIFDDTIYQKTDQIEIVKLLDLFYQPFDINSLNEIKVILRDLIDKGFLNCAHVEILSSIYCKYYFEPFNYDPISNSNFGMLKNFNKFCSLFLNEKRIHQLSISYDLLDEKFYENYNYHDSQFKLFLLSEFYRQNLLLYDKSSSLKKDLFFWLKIAESNKKNKANYSSAISVVVCILARDNKLEDCIRLLDSEICDKNYVNSNEKYFSTRILSSLISTLFEISSDKIEHFVHMWNMNFSEPIHFHHFENIFTKEWLNDDLLKDSIACAGKINYLLQFINESVYKSNVLVDNKFLHELTIVSFLKPILEQYVIFFSIYGVPLTDFFKCFSNVNFGEFMESDVFNQSFALTKTHGFPNHNKNFIPFLLLKYSIFNSLALRRIIQEINVFHIESFENSNQFENYFSCDTVMKIENPQLCLYSVVEAYKFGFNKLLPLSPSKDIWFQCFEVLKEDFILKLERRFDLTYFDALIRIFYEINFILTNKFIHEISTVLSLILEDYYKITRFPDILGFNPKGLLKNELEENINKDITNANDLILYKRSKSLNYLRLHSEPWKISQPNIVRILTSKSFQKGHIDGKPLSILFLLRLAPPNQNLWLAAIVGRFLVEVLTSKEQLINMAICQDILKRSCSNVISDCFVAFLNYIEGYNVEKFPSIAHLNNDDIKNYDKHSINLVNRSVNMNSLNNPLVNSEIFQTLNDAIIDRMLKNITQLYLSGYWKYLSSISYLTYRLIELNSLALKYFERRCLYTGDFTLFLHCLTVLNNRNVAFSENLTRWLNKLLINYGKSFLIPEDSNGFNVTLFTPLVTGIAREENNHCIVQPIQKNYEWPPFSTLITLTIHRNLLSVETLDFDTALQLLQLFVPYRVFSMVSSSLARFIVTNYKDMCQQKSCYMVPIITALMQTNHAGLCSSLTNNLSSINEYVESFSRSNLKPIFLISLSRCLKSISGPLSSIFHKLSQSNTDSDLKFYMKMERMSQSYRRNLNKLEELINEALYTNAIDGLMCCSAYNLISSTVFSRIHHRLDDFSVKIKPETALIFTLGVIMEEVFHTFNNENNVITLEKRLEIFKKISQLSIEHHSRIEFSVFDIDLIYSTITSMVLNQNFLCIPVEYMLNRTKVHSNIWNHSNKSHVERVSSNNKESFSVFKRLKVSSDITKSQCHPLQLFLRLGFDDPSTLLSLTNELIRLKYPDITLFQLNRHCVNFSWPQVDRIYQSNLKNNSSKCDESIRILQSLGYKVY